MSLVVHPLVIPHQAAMDSPDLVVTKVFMLKLHGSQNKTKGYESEKGIEGKQEYRKGKE